MLRELSSIKQDSGKTRRWFFCHEIDLVVWFDDAGSLIEFQLAYDKYRNEHSISWSSSHGFRHYIVDEGSPLPGASETPLLFMDGPFHAPRIIDMFRSLSGEIPKAITKFVIEKLASYPIE